MILWLCISFGVLAVGNSLYIGYRVQRDVLIESTLENNRIYALKLADTTNSMLTNAAAMLGFSGRMLSENSSQEVRQNEVDRLRAQTHYFNSVVIIDENGVVLAASPKTLDLVGVRIESPGALSALGARGPHISRPFRAITGRWAIILSHPIFDEDGIYRGFVGGVIYLHRKNILHDLLNVQIHGDGSYVYVIDSDGTVLYHPDASRIGRAVTGSNVVVDALLAGRIGTSTMLNPEGIPMLAGYAPISAATWGVVVQRPRKTALASLETASWRVVRTALPLLAVLLLVVWYLSALIARPLWLLASIARRLDSKVDSSEISRIKAWYFEAAELRRALLVGLGSLRNVISALREDSLRDALTGLFNRRGFEVMLTKLNDASMPAFGVLTVDIDHFKRVNDTYGHAAGDQVLKCLARLMRENARDGDVAVRTGGEEFLLLLPNGSLAQSLIVAERLRKAVEVAPMPFGGTITISIGVSHCPEICSSIDDAIKGADTALYAAKRAGRNRVMVAEPMHVMVDDGEDTASLHAL